MPALAAVLNLAAHYESIVVRLSPESLAAFLSTYDALQPFQWEGANPYELTDAEIDQIDNLVSTAFREIVTPVMTTPIGMISAFGGAVAPEGWLFCNGAAISRATYSDLFSVLGVNFGAGDGTTTFNLPNLDGRVPSGAPEMSAGVGTSQPLGVQFGAQDVTLALANIPPHNHSITTYVTSAAFVGSGAVTRNVINSSSAGSTGNTGGVAGAAQAFSVIQPSLAVKYIIRAIP